MQGREETALIRVKSGDTASEIEKKIGEKLRGMSK
jgi:hypothetical protein